MIALVDTPAESNEDCCDDVTAADEAAAPAVAQIIFFFSIARASFTLKHFQSCFFLVEFRRLEDDEYDCIAT